MSVAHKPAGSPHLRASQGLLPGAPPKRGATYQSYLERPTKPTSRGAGGTYIHTETTTRLHETQAQAGSPNKGNSTVETPTDRGERVKRSQNDIRAQAKGRVSAERAELRTYVPHHHRPLRAKSNAPALGSLCRPASKQQRAVQPHAVQLDETRRKMRRSAMPI